MLRRLYEILMGSSVSKSNSKRSSKNSLPLLHPTLSAFNNKSTNTSSESKKPSRSVDINFNNAHCYADVASNENNVKKDGPSLKWDLKPNEIREQVSVLHLETSIDRKETTLIEKSSVLKYKTPFFRASANVLVPALAEGVSMQVGWVQVIKDMIFVNQYGSEGITSWEFPELTTNMCCMISDSDGHRYPWYGDKREMVPLNGPTLAPSQVFVSMNDSFSPQVTWHIPVQSYGKEPRLTKVFRDQSFVTCLVALRTNAKTAESRLSVLNAISWRMQVDINVQPCQPLGQRASMLQSNRNIPQPVIEDMTLWDGGLEDRALHPPNANKCQMLVWRPHPTDEPSSAHPATVVVPSVWSTANMNNYFRDTNHLNSKLYQAIS